MMFRPPVGVERVSAVGWIQVLSMGGALINRAMKKLSKQYVK